MYPIRFENELASQNDVWCVLEAERKQRVRYTTLDSIVAVKGTQMGRLPAHFSFVARPNQTIKTK